MHWYLVVTLLGTDDLLVKQMESKQDCIKEQRVMESKIKRKMKYISEITCEEGIIMEKQDAGVKDEVL